MYKNLIANRTRIPEYYKNALRQREEEKSEKINNNFKLCPNTQPQNPTDCLKKQSETKIQDNEVRCRFR
jgi:hypothetical protein